MSGIPPQKPQTRAGQRLARISHHFLSESQAEEPQNNSRTTAPQIFVIADNPSQPFPTATLATQLARHGIHCEIHTPDQEIVRVQSAISTTATGNFNHRDEPVTVQLISGHPEKTAQDNHTLILPTPATAEGLRQSYLHIKHHVQQTRPLRIGITLTGTDDRAQAKYCFNALQQACQQLLSHEISQMLCSYGLLKHPQHHSCSQELSGIARLIINDCTTSFGNSEKRKESTMSDALNSEELL